MGEKGGMKRGKEEKREANKGKSERGGGGRRKERGRKRGKGEERKLCRMKGVPLGAYACSAVCTKEN